MHEVGNYKGKIDHPESPYIWVKALDFGEASTNFHDDSKSYWRGRVEVVENSNNGRQYSPGQVLFVRVGQGTPWFWRPQQYEEDRRSMFVQPCNVIAIESEDPHVS